MAVMTTNDFAKLLEPGLNTIFGHAYREKTAQWSQFMEERTSRRAYEEIISITGYGLPTVKQEGGNFVYDEEQQGFLTRFRPNVWALGFQISEEMLDDDLYSTVGEARTKGLAFSMRQGEEINCANILNRAFNTSYVGGDSATLIASAGGGGSATHPNVSGGTWTNGVATAADLSETVLEQAKIDIDDIRDDRGKRMQLNIKQLIVASSNQFEAERILKSKLRPETANNDVNALYAMGTIPKVIVNNYLTDPDAWFLQTDCPNGMLRFNRKPMRFAVDSSFDTGSMKFKVTHRYAVGWGDPRCMYGSPGA